MNELTLFSSCSLLFFVFVFFWVSRVEAREMIAIKQLIVAFSYMFFFFPWDWRHLYLLEIFWLVIILLLWNHEIFVEYLVIFINGLYLNVKVYSFCWRIFISKNIYHELLIVSEFPLDLRMGTFSGFIISKN